jgi:CubicO group peptidase (beta-lactamase class C family)
LANYTGSLEYSASFQDETGSAYSPDSTYWIASYTKLITTIAARQCVGRGLFSLEYAADVKTLIPQRAEFNEIIREADESGEPLLEKVTTDLTSRHLLTHTSGVGYDVSGPFLQS